LIIQGQGGAIRLIRRLLRQTTLVTILSVCLTACTSQVEQPAAPDHSQLDPAALLDVFLARERSMGTVKLVFSGDIVVKAGGAHHFSGVAGYRSCSALRIKLLGPVGFTLLEYLNTGGKALMIVDEVSPEGDEAAREGLLSLLEIFTLALLERCQPAADFKLTGQDASSVEFTTISRTNKRMKHTLDRNRAVLHQQIMAASEQSNTVVDYSDYSRAAGSWLPATIEIHGEHMPVSIRMQIRQWTVGADLPAGFFGEE
jgi:outer membrane biogenesis lipoprotein LolB